MRTPRKKPDDHVTGAQLRAARGVLNLSVLELSERTGLAVNTIKRAEKPNGPAPINVANAKLLTATLEAAGVTFLPAEEGLGAGVRLSIVDATPLTRRRRRDGHLSGPATPPQESRKPVT